MLLEEIQTQIQILFYQRDKVLSLRTHVPTPFTPDNLMYDLRGSLIVADHPHLQALVAVANKWVALISPLEPIL